MGILNITPDSFSDGGDFLDSKKALIQAEKMVQDGADILDIGAESSGPGSKEVPVDEEWRRLELVLSTVIHLQIPISVDTWKSEIAHRALQKGVHIINDVTAFRGDPKMIRTLQESDCKIVIMYSKDPNARTTAKKKEYDDPIQEIGDFLEERLEFATKNGINPNRIILDPGMGNFLSSDPKVSFKVLRELSRLRKRFPDNKILIGTSRKGFLGIVSDPVNPKNRLIASIASSLIATQNGADIVRVHDTKEMHEALKTYQLLITDPYYG